MNETKISFFKKNQLLLAHSFMLKVLVFLYNLHFSIILFFISSDQRKYIFDLHFLNKNTIDVIVTISIDTIIIIIFVKMLS